MQIKTPQDIVAFLFHYSNIFLSINSKVKIANKYGLGDKQICKYFQYSWKTGRTQSKVYNKYELMRLGRIANSYSYDF